MKEKTKEEPTSLGKYVNQLCYVFAWTDGLTLHLRYSYNSSSFS